jgi:hypothetical protein
MRVNLTLGELTGTNTLVGGTVLLETAVLCNDGQQSYPEKQEAGR